MLLRTIFSSRHYMQEEAFQRSRQRDDAWIADYALTKLRGRALIWYYTLDEEAQWSWKKLRLALIGRFGTTHIQPVPSYASARSAAAPAPGAEVMPRPPEYTLHDPHTPLPAIQPELSWTSAAVRNHTHSTSLYSSASLYADYAPSEANSAHPGLSTSFTPSSSHSEDESNLLRIPDQLGHTQPTPSAVAPQWTAGSQRSDYTSERSIAVPPSRVQITPPSSVGFASPTRYIPRHHRHRAASVPSLPSLGFSNITVSHPVSRPTGLGTLAPTNDYRSRRGCIKLIKAADGHTVGYISGFASDPWNSITPYHYEALMVEIPSMPPNDGSPWEMKIIYRPGFGVTGETKALVVFGRSARRNPDRASWSFKRYRTDVVEDGREDASDVWILRDDGLGGEELVMMWQYTAGGSDMLMPVKTSGIKSTTLSLRAPGYTLALNETVLRMVFEDALKEGDGSSDLGNTSQQHCVLEPGCVSLVR